MAKNGKKTKTDAEKKVADVAKATKFRELAGKRMDKALKAVGNLGNLSNRSSYSYSDAQVREMIEALANAVKAVQSRFSAPAASKGGAGFQFSA